MSFNINGLDCLYQHGTDRRSVEPSNPQRKRNQLVRAVGDVPQIQVLEDRRASVEQGTMGVERLALAVVHRRRVDAEQPEPTAGEPSYAPRRQRRPGIGKRAARDRTPRAKQQALDPPW